MNRTFSASLLLVALVSPLAVAACGSSGPAREGTLTVLTRNMDEGTDFAPLVKASSAAQFLTAAATAWDEVQASNIPERAVGVAKQIAADRPDLVSIEEAAIWRTGPLLKGPATKVVYDALGSLRSALASDGVDYRLVSVESEFDLEGPTSLGYDVRVTDEDAILARSGLRLSDVHSGHFSSELTLTPVGLKEIILRGWNSVDVGVGGRTVRYVETHLESFSNPVQMAQAGELLAGPANTPLPVIVACDCNTGPGVTPTYSYLLSKGGFTDAWTATHPGQPGFTWPLHQEDPYAAVASPSQRIDLVLIKGSITPRSAELVGNTPASLTQPSGLWPSDHAGVSATVAVK